jgi:2-oxoisovalerate dehydrogenase E2 component (dihydrolipoyl transacylase)
VPDIKQFKLPDVGEGLTEADILAWRVAVGDTVEVNQILVEVETAKAAVELPSPYAGVVTALHVSDGQTVDVGTPIISIDTAPGTDGPGSADSAATTDPVPVPQEPGIETGGERHSVLVGYGPRADGGGRRRRRTGSPAPSAQAAFDVTPRPAAVPPVEPSPDADLTEPSSEPTPVPTPPTPAPHRVLATPPVRKLAKSLGVDLATVAATGPHGTITRADLERAGAPGPGGELGTTDGAVARSGARETRIPIKGVRKHTAAAMVTSAFTAPHVTEFITLDLTATMELRERVAARREFRDVKVSPLLFVARAVILAARRTPEINASWDEAAGEIVLKHYVNLGIAAATDRGLVVPNIKDADALSLVELAQALTDLADTARAGRTAPGDMAGGTITITNVGVFGVDTGTPILNPGEAGIVAFGAIRRMPWVVGTGADERIEPRWVTQLAVSFDHRMVDGQQGSQFLADVAGILTDPGLALL